jgi:predicted HNH restriction endonuclease
MGEGIKKMKQIFNTWLEVGKLPDDVKVVCANCHRIAHNGEGKEEV